MRATLFSCCMLFALPVHAKCTLGEAVYQPVGHASGEFDKDGKTQAARHVPRGRVTSQAEFVLRLSESESKSSYDFGFAFPNGHGGTALVYAGPTGTKRKVKESASDLRILYFNADLKEVASHEFELSSEAPAYLIMPGMGSAFWYGFDTKRKLVPMDGLWKASCAQ